LKLYAKET